MNSYEGIFILRPDLGKEDLAKLTEKIQEVIGKHKGSVEKLDDWGKRSLAYAIKKHKEGIYCLINFHLDPEAVSKIKRIFGLNEEILRTLIVRI